MSEYVTLPDEEKLALLQAHCLVPVPSLDRTLWCLHCELQFSVRQARVYRRDGQLWLECGTPNCDGSPIDWAEYPWWDENHPLTKAHMEGDEYGQQHNGDHDLD